MKDMGSAMMGTGEASGQNRATKAAQAAISNPLLTDISLRGAQGLLISIIGGRNLTLFEVDEAASCVKQDADPEANIIVGATFEEGMDESIRVSIVASGLPGGKAHKLTPPLAEATAPDGGQAETRRSPGDHEVNNNSKDSSIAQTADGQTVRTESYEKEGAPPSGKPPELPSKPESGGDSGDPYLGQTSADEFARALSEVIGTVDDQDGNEIGRKQMPNYASPDAAPTWKSPEGVVIEEGLGPVDSPPPLPHKTNSDEVRSRQNADFVPRPPEQLPRRLPEMSDFPKIAQRAYEAKTEKYSDQSSSPRDVPQILKRLARLGRQANHSDGAPGNIVSRHDETPQKSDSATPDTFFTPGQRRTGNL